MNMGGLPLPPGAIICPIQLIRNRKYQDPNIAPQWTYTDQESTPTPQLQQRGLSPGLLQQELQEVNNKSVQIFKSTVHKRMSYLWIPGVAIPIGFILMIVFGKYWYLGIAVVAIAGLSCLIMCAVFTESTGTCVEILQCSLIATLESFVYCTGKQLNDVKPMIKQSVEEYLNEKWNQNGIKWTVLTLNYRGRDGCFDSRAEKIRIHHLVCSQFLYILRYIYDHLLQCILK